METDRRMQNSADLSQAELPSPCRRIVELLCNLDDSLDNVPRLLIVRTIRIDGVAERVVACLAGHVGHAPVPRDAEIAGATRAHGLDNEAIVCRAGREVVHVQAELSDGGLENTPKHVRWLAAGARIHAERVRFHLHFRQRWSKRMITAAPYRVPPPLKTRIVGHALFTFKIFIIHIYIYYFLKKNLNASRPSEHPTQGGYIYIYIYIYIFLDLDPIETSTTAKRTKT